MIYSHGFYPEHAFIGGLFTILFWVALIAFVVWVARNVSTKNDSCGHEHHTGSSALNILKERYARGEIQKEEFEIKKKDLSE